MTRSLVLAVALSLSVAAGACSKADSPPTTEAVGPAKPSPSASASPVPPPEPTASALASAEAPASASVPPPAAPPASATARRVSPAAFSPSVAAAATCGDKPLAPCPLYAWMKANTSTAMAAQNFGAMASALDKIVSFAPAGYANWASVARDGASAAREQNYDAVRASCRGCHNQYKEKYKKEMRDRAI